MLRTSGFVDDIMFSYNGANGPESKKTRAYVSSSSPSGDISRTSDNFYEKYASILYHFRDVASDLSKVANFSYPTYTWRPL